MQFLGSGARSTIWEVRNNRTGESYALKRVVRHNQEDQRFIEQALTEYETAGKLDHPHVRKVHELKRVKKWFTLREIRLLMEHCPGQTVQESRPKEVPKVAEVFGKVADALAHINAQGYVHADMKPNNIVVDGEGVKIIDLGQSCPIGTIKQRIQGTPDFIAPEQVRREPLDGRTDVFNFGASLYWTLTGKPIPTYLPKKGAVTLVSEMAVQPPMEINKDVPPPLNKLVLDCIEVIPSNRPAGMKDVASRLGLIHHTMVNGLASRRTDA